MNLAEGLKVWIALLEIKLLDLLCLFQYRLSLMFLRLGGFPFAKISGSFELFYILGHFGESELDLILFLELG